jgi:ATP-binding cassette, subfamily B, multidrug efflux pump
MRQERKQKQRTDLRNPRGAKGTGSPKGKPRGPAWPIIVRLATYVRAHPLLTAAVVVAALLTTAIDLLPPWIIRLSIDRFILPGRYEAIWVAAAGLLAISVVHGGIDFLRLFLSAYVGQKIVFRIRNSIFEHLNRLSFSYYDKARTGDLMSRVTADTDVLSQLFGRAGIIVLTNMVFLLGVLAVLFVWNWRLGIIYLCILPLMAQAIRIYARRVRPAMGKVRQSLGALNSSLQGTLVGIMVLKIFGREKFEEDRFDVSNSSFLKANVSTIKIRSLWMPYVNVLMGVAMGLVLWLGGYSVIEGAITLGTLVAFTTYINMLMRPIRQTGMMMTVIMRSLASAERVFEVLDTEPEIKDAPDAYAMPQIEGHVRLKKVSFSYDDKNPVLKDVSLDAKPGEMVAFVGPSGAGKSTLVHLIPRFYDISEGTVLLDEHDVRGVTVESLRARIGIALQSVYLFDTSVRENIAYGSPGASEDDIERVARQVAIHDFIASLPMGYGTPVGERGVRLSGGQKQRVALARVLLTDPRILILDEPTSSVDAETERRMQQAFENARAGRTTFVIAHRLWTVQHADQIIVLRDGLIIEHGTTGDFGSAHQGLMNTGGFYKELFELQFRGEVVR